jgi:hypothetical protein
MKSIFKIFFLVFVFSNSNAQFIIGAKVGGHLPTSGMALPGFVQIEQDGTQKVLVATLGAGVDFNALLGYQLNENVALNMDIGYLNGFKGGFYQYVNLLGTGPTNKVDVAFKSTFFSVTPNVVIKASERKGKMRPYARIGVHMGSGTVESTTKIDIFEGKLVEKYSGGWTVGLMSGLGLNKQVNDQLNTFFELTVKTITTRPKQLENLENFTGAPKEETINFVKEITPDSPETDQLIFTIPFSSIGVSIGIQYRLGK